MPFNQNFNFNFADDGPFQRVWTFKQAGVLSLPPGVVFACASVRNPETSPGVVVLNIPTNQACSSYLGQLIEPQVTNYCEYSQAFNSWSNNSATIEGYIADPAGNTSHTAVDAQTTTATTNLYYGLSGTVANVTVSCWSKKTGGANLLTFGPADSSVAGIAQLVLTPTTTWARYANTVAGNARAFNYQVIGDSRLDAGANPQRAGISFCQIENNLWATSYTITGGAVATRAGATQTLPVANKANNVIDLTFPAGCSIGTQGACIIEGDGTNSFSFSAGGTFATTFGGGHSGSTNYSSANGTIRVRVTALGSSGKAKLELWNNNVLMSPLGGDVLNIGSAFNFASKNIYMSNNGLGTACLPAYAYSRIAWQ
jgi:hypothetical protein